MFTPVLSSVSAASVNQKEHSFEVNTKEKIEAELEEEFSTNKQASFIIKFKEEAETQSVIENVKTQAKKGNLSSYETELKQRSAVISELKSTAIKSQENVLTYLNEQEKLGNVTDLQSFFIINGIALTATEEVAKQISAYPEVKEIVLNKVYELPELQTVQSKEVQSEDQDIEWNVERIGAPDVWNLGFDGTGIVVANMDSGVDWTHPALKHKYRGYNKDSDEVDHTYSWYDPAEGNPEPNDGNGHGTHVMGTIVGSEENGSNKIGVAPGAEWIAVKVFNSFGQSNDANLIGGAEWIMAPGGRVDLAPDVVNNSWSSGYGRDDWYREIVQRWVDAEIFPAFAAGNVSATNPGGPGSVSNPSNYPESFAVGATDSDNQIASFSLRGPSPYGEIKPDIAAPGASIRSSVPGGNYNLNNGTSMASPALAGVVALLKQADSSLQVEDIKEILKNTAIPLTDAEYPDTPNNAYGNGLVDAYNAVASIIEGSGRVTGKVVSNVEDNEAPSYEHEKPKELFEGVRQEFILRASDNVSITSVSLTYKINDGKEKTIDAQRISGDYINGDYAVTIPGDDLKPGTLYYYWTVNDHGNNEITTELYDVSVKERLTVGYFEDFETEPSGWNSYGENDSWERGVPSSGPKSAYSGENVYATNLSGPYDNDMDATLQMPPIFIPEGKTFLQFYSWHDFTSLYGTDYNYGRLMISQDGENWTELERFVNESKEWTPVEIDLSKYAGEEVHIGFNAYSDFRITKDGWYIDDVGISDKSIYEDLDDEEPSFTHSAPSEVYKGLDAELYIDVEDDIKIAEVELTYKNADNDWKTVSAKQISGDEKKGTFVAKIIAEHITGEAIDYKWIVNDYGNNQVESDLYEVQVKEAITVGYYEDFTSIPSGWYSFGESDDWEIGIPTSGPNKAATGENVYATNLSGNYTARTDATLVMPPVSLPEGDVFLHLEHWYNFRIGGGEIDLGNIVISTDGEDWTTLESFDRSSGGWIKTAIDLSDYSGSDLLIGFQIKGEGSLTQAGWYIDRVSLSDHDDSPLQSINQQFEERKDLHEQLNPKLIPLGAKLSVLETGRTVATDARTGEYNFLHESGEFTLRAEAYGYRAEETVTRIVDNDEIEVNFILEEKNEYTLSGRVVDVETGEALDHATVLLVEDANVQPVKTDEDGQFSLIAYEGEYTLKVIANGYYEKESLVNLSEDQSLDIELEAFYSHGNDEIYYDDGTAENAKAFYNEGNGWAVKMSLKDYERSALVTEGIFKFWDQSFPAPGGTEFAVEVWDAKGSGGLPGNKLAGPIEAEAIRDKDEWTVVDLRSENIIVDGDFYMVYMQTKDGNNSPGLAMDEDGTLANRSYEYVGGGWSKLAGDENSNMMIRANVDYLFERPVITNPSNGLITKEETITIQGNANPETNIDIYHNDEEVATTQSTEEGVFEAEVSLNEGENTLSALTSFEDKDFSSEPVIVTLDTIAPELTIDNPTEGQLIEEDFVTVTGTVSDKHLDEVTVDGEPVEVENNSYSKTVALSKGENVITVIARDLAGNVTEKTVTIHSSAEQDIIHKVLPAEDLYVTTGDEVNVSFESFITEGEASFTIQLPLLQSDGNETEIPMTETDQGVYQGKWTVGEGLNVDGAVIEVRIIDQDNKLHTKKAKGKLFIQSDEDDDTPPTPVEKPEIYQVTPNEDITVLPGDELPITLESNVEGGKANFNIQLPHGLTSETESNMTEVEAGKYEGLWKVPENIKLEEVTIQVTVTNKDGLTATKTAKGSVTILQDQIDRIKGDSRFGTASEISKAGWTKSDTVILARNDDYADALAGVPLAYELDAPILLTRTKTLPEETLEEIERLEAKNVIVLGGSLAITDEVVDALEGKGLEVERLYGKSRTDTAVEIAKRLAPEGIDQAIVVSGWDFPDALSVASHAAMNGQPILLTHPDKLSEPTANALEELEVKETIVIGGSLAIEDKVLAELPNPKRINGSNRIETNIAVQEHFKVESDHLYVATGNDFADSLTGAVLAAKNNSSILLVRNSLADVTAKYITENQLKRLTLFGGSLAISEELEAELEKTLQE